MPRESAAAGETGGALPVIGLDGALQPPKAQLQRDYHRAAATVGT